MNNLPCNWAASSFTDPNRGHIPNGGMRIVQNNKLRKLLCKGPKYRDIVFINFSNSKSEIKNSLTKFLPIVAIKRVSLSNALHNG